MDYDTGMVLTKSRYCDIALIPDIKLPSKPDDIAFKNPTIMMKYNWRQKTEQSAPEQVTRHSGVSVEYTEDREAHLEAPGTEASHRLSCRHRLCQLRAIHLCDSFDRCIHGRRRDYRRQFRIVTVVHCILHGVHEIVND